MFKCSVSPRDEKEDETRDMHAAPEIRDVFGDFDEDEEMGYAAQQDIEQDSNVSKGANSDIGVNNDIFPLSVNCPSFKN